jgi:hypothetical protein
LLESIMMVAAEPDSEQHPAPRTGRLLREARTCYDHLAGALGSALLARTLELGWIVRANAGQAVSVTPKGRRGFSNRFGID